MHKCISGSARPPSCLAILIRNMSILQQNTKKAAYLYARPKPALTRYRQIPHMSSPPILGRRNGAVQLHFSLMCRCCPARLPS